MAKKITTNKPFVEKINLKILTSLTIVSLSISFLVKIFIVNDRSNKNNVTIGETGESSNVTISQNNIQNTTYSYGEILFISFLLLGLIGIIFIFYKMRQSKNEK